MPCTDCNCSSFQAKLLSSSRVSGELPFSKMGKAKLLSHQAGRQDTLQGASQEKDRVIGTSYQLQHLLHVAGCFSALLRRTAWGEKEAPVWLRSAGGNRLRWSPPAMTMTQMQTTTLGKVRKGVSSRLGPTCCVCMRPFHCRVSIPLPQTALICSQDSALKEKLLFLGGWGGGLSMGVLSMRESSALDCRCNTCLQDFAARFLPRETSLCFWWWPRRGGGGALAFKELIPSERGW